MRRRTFLAALPLVAAGAVAGAQRVPGANPSRASDPQPPEEARVVRPDVHAGDRPVGASFGSRSPVYGRSGAAGTAHPLATLAGIEILKDGGSAVDAAIAINACLGFLEPTSSGIGGDVYAMLWDPAHTRRLGMPAAPRGPARNHAHAPAARFPN